MFKTSSHSSGISSSESYGEILTDISTSSTLTNVSKYAWVSDVLVSMDSELI